MLKDAKLLKKEILEIKDGEKLMNFLKKNKIEIETDDRELQEHFKKYINFGISEDKEKGIIFDLRNK